MIDGSIANVIRSNGVKRPQYSMFFRERPSWGSAETSSLRLLHGAIGRGYARPRRPGRRSSPPASDGVGAFSELTDSLAGRRQCLPATCYKPGALTFLNAWVVLRRRRQRALDPGVRAESGVGCRHTGNLGSRLADLLPWGHCQKKATHANHAFMLTLPLACHRRASELAVDH
jgi:hypothetical protein